MQPPKVHQPLPADELARDARKAGVPADRQTKEGEDTDALASEDDAATKLADAQERVVDRGLTRLPTG